MKSANTMCKTSKVTAYCMFSIEARRTLLSGSSFFPSRPTLNCNNKERKKLHSLNLTVLAWITMNACTDSKELKIHIYIWKPCTVKLSLYASVHKEIVALKHLTMKTGPYVYNKWKTLLYILSLYSWHFL